METELLVSPVLNTRPYCVLKLIVKVFQIETPKYNNRACTPLQSLEGADLEVLPLCDAWGDLFLSSLP